MNADVSKDYILFSPTRLAAHIKKVKLQQSLQNHSASVLTVPSGLDFSALTATLPQPGEVLSYLFLPFIVKKKKKDMGILIHKILT